MNAPAALMAVCCTVAGLLSPADAQPDTTAPTRSIAFTWENDVFFHTDRYYSQGIFLSWTDPAIGEIPGLGFLIGATPTRGSATVSLVNKLFTPRTIKSPPVPGSDRPYAGLTFLQLSAITPLIRHPYRVSRALHVGVIGRASGTEQLQKALHRATSNPQPQGWEQQIGNGPVVDYSVGILRHFGRTHMAADLGPEITLGTIRTEASLTGRGEIRTGGLGDRGLRAGLHTAVQITGVAYDGTLQGAAFMPRSGNELRADDVRHLRGFGMIGAEAGWRAVVIGLTVNLQSPTCAFDERHWYSGICLRIE